MHVQKYRALIVSGRKLISELRTSQVRDPNFVRVERRTPTVCKVSSAQCILNTQTLSFNQSGIQGPSFRKPIKQTCAALCQDPCLGQPRPSHTAARPARAT